MTTDEHWMERALILARKGLGLTTPNPPVGAVIVRDGHEIASGWHHAAGRPHAEREAISDAAARAVDIRGATIYVTLEPCSSHGRTGACTKALISAGLARVVYGSCDPKHAGAADAILHEKGIVVESGVRQKKCDWLIRGFSSVQERGRPWVILKSGMSLDGRLTRPPGESQWLTSLESREKVQLLRAEVDAILTSGETVRRDNPVLSLRSPAISPEKNKLGAWSFLNSKEAISPIINCAKTSFVGEPCFLPPKIQARV